MLDGFMNAFSGLGGYFKAHEGLPFAPLSLVRAHAPRALAFVSEEVELRMGAGPLADFVQPEGVKGEEGLQLLRIVDNDDGVGIAVVLVDDASELLLACGVPELELDEVAAVVEGPGSAQCT